MTRFDWRRFCDQHKIPYVTDGPNTSAGNISIKCPWCGPSDPSEHMGLSLNVGRPFYSCWRSQMHRGANPAILIAKLLGWLLPQAIKYIEGQADNPDPFEDAVASLSESRVLQRKPRAELKMPPDFRQFDAFGKERFLSYLKSRGFGQAALNDVVSKYRLRYAITGDFKERVIIPVYHEGQLVTWTARAINPLARLRYKSLESEKSLRNIKDCLLLHDNSLKNAQLRVLIICEGPMDAIKVDTYGTIFGLSATCLFGLTISPGQLSLLSRWGRAFRQIVVLLDSAARTEAGIICSQIGEILGKDIYEGQLPTGIKDPGELTSLQVRNLATTILQLQG